MPDEAQELADHFEGVLDEEAGVTPPPKPSRKETDEDDPEQLFPEQEVDEDED